MGDIHDTPLFGSVDDLVHAVFKDYFTGVDVRIHTTFSEHMAMPAIVSRRDRRSGTIALHSKDERFMLPAILMVSTLTAGVDADADGEALQEQCRHALFRAQQMQLEIPGCGSIAVVQGSTHPAKVSDWQTATSVVQYAALPKGACRYEAIYRVLIRPPIQSTIHNRFKPPHI